jgi:hypothetical protein
MIEKLLKKARELSETVPGIDYVTIVDCGEMYLVTFARDSQIEKHEKEVGDYFWEIWEGLPLTYKHQSLIVALTKAIDKVKEYEKTL